MSMLTPRLTAETFSFAPVQIAASSWTASSAGVAHDARGQSSHLCTLASVRV